MQGFGRSEKAAWGDSDSFWPDWLGDWLSAEKGIDYVRISAFDYETNYEHNLLAVAIEDAASHLLDSMRSYYRSYGNVVS